MKALGTNVLARFLIGDSKDAQTAKQRPAAIAAMETRAFIAVTVLLEFEWVMRGFYKLPRSAITRVLTALAGLGHVTLEDRAAVTTRSMRTLGAPTSPTRCTWRGALGRRAS